MSKGRIERWSQVEMRVGTELEGRIRDRNGERAMKGRGGWEVLYTTARKGEKEGRREG